MKANSWNEFRPTPPERFRWTLLLNLSWILRPTLQLKIKANSSTENEGQLLEWIQANPPQEDSGEPFYWILRPTLQLKIEANSSAENEG